MTRNSIIAGRIREVFLDGYFIANTNYKKQLGGLNWLHSVQKIDNLNTIAALTYHINYYLAGLLSAFESGKLEIHDKFSFDLPAITTEMHWNRLVAELLDNAEKFACRVEQMDDSQFDQPFIAEQYGTYLRNIEAVIEHSYYHLGQISLILKMMAYRNLLPMS